MFGEWLYARHTIAYDELPHYFLGFDILDRDTGSFLSADCRHALLAGSPVQSVPVLASSTTCARKTGFFASSSADGDCASMTIRPEISRQGQSAGAQDSDRDRHHCHAGDLVGLASETDRPEVRWNCPSCPGTTSHSRRARGLSGAHGGREPGLGLSPNRGRIDQPWARTGSQHRLP
jgi:hypothetical protein